MSGKALGVGTDETQVPPQDVNGFNIRSWIKGTALVTRSVPVCGRPQLMGLIEGLKDELVRVQAVEFDDDRPLAKSAAMELAQQLEGARKQMLAAMVTFRFRGLRNGELEEIKAAHGTDEGDTEGFTDLDYKVWAAQCVDITSPQGVAKGIGWEDLKILHRGNGLAEDDPDYTEGLGSYFVQTIARTANAAASGAGVDIPFSSASSSLMASSSKS